MEIYLVKISLLLGALFIVGFVMQVLQMRKTDDWNLFIFPRSGFGKSVFWIWNILLISSLIATAFTPIFAAVNQIIVYLGLMLLQIYSMREKSKSSAG